VNARLAVAALLLAATAFASAAERDGGSILIGAGAKVAASKCLLSSDCDLNSDFTSLSHTVSNDGRGAIACGSNCDVTLLTLRLGTAAVAARESTVKPTLPPKS
jgi:hypothetical protein